eukprot:6014083-Amphidinium_carterae.1
MSSPQFRWAAPRSPDKEKVVQRELAARVRLMSVRHDTDRMLAIGSIDGPFLGPVAVTSF